MKKEEEERKRKEEEERLRKEEDADKEQLSKGVSCAKLCTNGSQHPTTLFVTSDRVLSPLSAHR